MKTLTTHLLRLTFLGVLLAFALGINYVMAAWTSAPPNPPSGNVSPPINTGSDLQIKSGPMQINSTLDVRASTTVRGGISFYRGASIIDPAYTIDMGPLPVGAPFGIRFPDNTVQTTAYVAPATPAPTGALMAVRSYTASGTWTKPAGLSYAVVEVWGGGASGQNYAGVDGTAGGVSSFGTQVSASGGALSTDGRYGGTPGSGSGGDINMTGGRGASISAYDGNIASGGGVGGDAPRGGMGGVGGWSNDGGTGNGSLPGGGGGGAGDHHAANSPAAGSAGGYAYKRIDASAVGATVAVTVGAGGVGNAHESGRGGNGARGMVVVYEYQ